MSFKVGVFVNGESKPSYNGLRFASSDEAEQYGRDLRGRWTLVDRFAVEESSDPVNYRWTDQGLQAVAPAAERGVA